MMSSRTYRNGLYQLASSSVDENLWLEDGSFAYSDESLWISCEGEESPVRSGCDEIVANILGSVGPSERIDLAPSIVHRL